MGPKIAYVFKTFETKTDSRHAAAVQFRLAQAVGFFMQIGRDVTSGDVQGIINLMTSANLLMRFSHGVYGVTDSFVEKAWLTRLQADNLLRPDAPPDNAATA